MGKIVHILSQFPFTWLKTFLQQLAEGCVVQTMLLIVAWRVKKDGHI